MWTAGLNAFARSINSVAQANMDRNFRFLKNYLRVKASITPEQNQLRINPNFRIRMDSGAFCSPTPNGRKFVRDSETFVEGFGLFRNVQNQSNTLKNGPEYGPDKFHSGHIRDTFGWNSAGFGEAFGAF